MELPGSSGMATPEVRDMNAADDVQIVGHVLLIEAPPDVPADRDLTGTFLSGFVAGQDLVWDCGTDSLSNPVGSVRTRLLRITPGDADHSEPQRAPAPVIWHDGAGR